MKYGLIEEESRRERDNTVRKHMYLTIRIWSIHVPSIRFAIHIRTCTCISLLYNSLNEFCGLPSLPPVHFRPLEVFPLNISRGIYLEFCVSPILLYCTVLCGRVGHYWIARRNRNMYDEEEVRSPYCLFKDDASDIALKILFRGPESEELVPTGR